MDINKRLSTHNSAKGAKYTRSRLPVVLVYSQEFETKSEALAREYYIKKLKLIDKKLLIDKNSLPTCG